MTCPHRRGAPGTLPFLLLLLLLLALAAPAGAAETPAPGYTLGPATLRAAPRADAAAVADLDANDSVTLLAPANDGWVRARAVNGREGFLPADAVSAVRIVVRKEERALLLLDGFAVLRTFPVALCPFNPLGDKVRQGDGATPEGRFFVCESLREPGAAKYGARSMRLSYPEIEDARRGLAAGLVDYPTYAAIVAAVRRGKMPPQETPLGGSIRIHGGGSGEHWTLGCVALDDDDIRELFDLAPARVRVDVFRSRAAELERSRPWRIASATLDGVEEGLARPALYTDAAAGYLRLPYPGGDLDPGEAVCTDVIIRALRRAGIDLQAELHEDLLLRPGRYARLVDRPDPSIDHRRVKNLVPWFDAHLPILARTSETPLVDFLPGDLVTFDTGIRNGTVHDHIGIVSTRVGPSGAPLVFNIWTTGCRASLMDLLAGDYPAVTGHWRPAVDLPEPRDDW